MHMEIIKLTTGPDRKCDSIGIVVLINGAVYNGICHDNNITKKGGAIGNHVEVLL